MVTTRNRNAVVKWFITFPHSGEYTPKAFCLSLLTLSCIVSVCGVRETHSDGITPHIHLNLHSKYKLTKVQFLKKIQELHPEDYKRIDIRPTRESPEKAKEGYLSKEGVDIWYYSNDTVKQQKALEKKLTNWNRRYDVELSGKVNVIETMKKWDYEMSFSENKMNNFIYEVEPQLDMLRVE